MKVNSVAVLGLQWGDEGKGKVIDFLSSQVDAVVRFGGGANAGHTIVTGGEKFILKLLPSGVLHEGKLCFIGAGVACDLEILSKEISDLKNRGISSEDRVFIDYGAHVVLPLHKVSDGYLDEGKGKDAIDTTKRGIGPTYADKASRIGIRVADIFDQKTLTTKIGYLIEAHRRNLGNRANDPSLVDANELGGELLRYEPLLRKLSADIGPRLLQLIDDGKKVLFEGAQGSLLDLDFGTYPFVTSSHTTIGGIFIGLGIPPSCLGSSVGVFKAYMTRVGSGPFPTEINGDLATELREKGGEYGSVTKRPRRVGWLDLANLKRIVRLNGINRLAVTKIDVLDGLKEIKVCESYEIDGEPISDLAPSHPDFARAKPVYKNLPGWDSTTAGVDDLEKLPLKARAYLDYISEKVDVPIWLISTGFTREHTIITKGDLFN